MKFHETLVEVLLKTYEVNSGWTEERKIEVKRKRLNLYHC